MGIEEKLPSGVLLTTVEFNVFCILAEGALTRAGSGTIV